jgi:hypothetical protein
MASPKRPRIRIPVYVETGVLAKSARRCALCFHLHGDLKEQLGQIAHLDGDRNNVAQNNLAFMCLPHHSLFDSQTSQHKNYTIAEVKDARARLYTLVASGSHLTPAAAQPFLQAEADKKTLRDLLEIVPSNGPIRFLRSNNFGGFSFEWRRVDDIERFLYDRNGPDHEFLDSGIEAARKTFRKACRALLVALVTHTFPTHTSGYQAVPDEWELDQPDRFREAVDEIHTAASAVCNTYDELVRLARRKLRV